MKSFLANPQLWRLTFRTRFSTELREPIDIEDKDERTTVSGPSADEQSESKGKSNKALRIGQAFSKRKTLLGEARLMKRILYRLCMVSRAEEQHAMAAGSQKSEQEVTNDLVAMLHEDKRSKW
jgi:hypothetical protein